MIWESGFTLAGFHRRRSVPDCAGQLTPNAGRACYTRERLIMQAWNVYLYGKCIDTVFYQKSCDSDYVRRGLVEHDGYDPAITVRRCNKYRL